MAEESAGIFKIWVPGIERGAKIPVKYTCDGFNISPMIKWTAPPEGTKSLALIFDDPDAPMGTWVHWVVFNIPPDTRMLAEGLISGASKFNFGKNDFRTTKYGGPCPPPGKPHRYFLRLYALDIRIDKENGISRKELDRAMEGHILASTEWFAVYSRKK